MQKETELVKPAGDAGSAGTVIQTLRDAPLPPRPRLEEALNCLTHGLGLALSLAGLPVLIVLAASHGGGLETASVAVYGTALVALYAASTMYHGTATGQWKAFFRTLDHSSIYVLIAGSYTPFTLVSLGGKWGLSLFIAVWSLAAVGIACKVFSRRRREGLSTVTFVLMGWMGILAIQPIVERLPLGCILWILAGGAFYTLGVPFYALDRKPYLHVVWHLFVLAGSVSHYVAVVAYVVPAGA